MSPISLEDFRERLAAWQAENPLRLWRLDRRVHAGRFLRLSDVAAATGKSVTAIAAYERGDYAPSALVLEVLSHLLDISPEKLERRWKEWEAKRPKVR